MSGDPSLRDDTQHMVDWFENELNKYGVETKQVDLGYQTIDGQQLKLPNAILGRVGNDPAKKTVLVYGHMDVQPVSKISVIVSSSNTRLLAYLSKCRLR